MRRKPRSRTSRPSALSATSTASPSTRKVLMGGELGGELRCSGKAYMLQACGLGSPQSLRFICRVQVLRPRNSRRSMCVGLRTIDHKFPQVWGLSTNKCFRVSDGFCVAAWDSCIEFMHTGSSPAYSVSLSSNVFDSRLGRISKLFKPLNLKPEAPTPNPRTCDPTP